MAFDVGGNSGGRIVPSMNVTPLVDVVLVLLIIFMVVTPLLTKQAWMNVPPAPKDEVLNPLTAAPPPVVLTIDATGKARINGEEVSDGQLLSELQRMLNARPDKVVFFDADSKAPYEKAVAVLDRVKGGGIDTIAVLAEELPTH